MRAVLLTASAAALGFLPITISTSAEAEVQRSLATVVIGGLMTATLLTLIVLPVLFSIFDSDKKKNLEMLHINPVSVAEGKIVSQVNIYSPIDGYVTQVFVNTGTYVSPADKIMEIMNTNHIQSFAKAIRIIFLKLTTYLIAVL